MKIEEILKRVDHTLLNPSAVFDEVKALIDDAVFYGAASVCIPPAFVKDAADYAKGQIPVCTVVAFPNGYSTRAAKCFEARDAVQNGADEIDMVINIAALKEKKYSEVLDEINAVKKSCGVLLKVIAETCLLTEEEKIKICEIVSASDADFIKTSTGFSKGGATRGDVTLFAAHVKNGTKIKAAGGIATLGDAEDFITLGADRLGTSRIIKLIKEERLS